MGIAMDKMLDAVNRVGSGMTGEEFKRLAAEARAEIDAEHNASMKKLKEAFSKVPPMPTTKLF